MSFTSDIIKDFASNKLSNVGNQILHQVSNKFCSRISVNNATNGNVFELYHVIYLLDQPKFNAHRDCINYEDPHAYVLRCDTKYIIPCKNQTYVYVHVYDKEARDGYLNRYLDLVIYGKNHKDTLNRIINKFKELKKQNKIIVKNISQYQVDYGSASYNDLLVIPTSFNEIILPSQVKEKLMQGVARWKTDKGWYNKHRIPYKLGILLYGKPGSGKTSITKAISHYFDNAPILYANSFEDYELNQVVRMRQMINGTFIVLLEDIDMIIESAKRTDETFGIKHDIKTAKIQRNLFQILDGIYSMDNVIYIATTNYIDHLDEGFIRPGRFDIQLEVPYFDESLALQFCQKFGYEKDTLDTLDVNYPIQPSKLQSMIMGIRSKEYSKKEN